MREIRPYGSEGGAARKGRSYPYLVQPRPTFGGLNQAGFDGIFPDVINDTKVVAFVTDIAIPVVCHPQRTAPLQHPIDQSC